MEFYDKYIKLFGLGKLTPVVSINPNTTVF